ncbi:hypothetical protein [Streptomyces sp. PD-S100-1]|uniref:hypothetical protein n=1 Tax=Streptomyces sp. PD-S100-1 TaxID=3394351 RepID=UPI0039BC80E1
MNTERPDHDDAAEAAGNGAAGGGASGTAPGSGTSGAGTSGSGASGSGEDTSGGDTARTESGGGRSRWGRGPLMAASVAAAVLLVGGGGAYLAAGASDGRTESAASSGQGTPPPLVLDGYSAQGTGGSGTAGIAPGEPDPYGATYRAAGALPAGPGSAPVYTARGEVTRAEAARLAKAFGVEGAPVAEARAWRVGAAKDGSGPVLRVDRQAPGSWTFSRYTPGTDDCKGATCGHGPIAPADRPVSVAAAEKAVVPVLKAVGQGDAAVDARQVMGAQRAVTAEPRVGGLPTSGWTTDLVVGVRGELVGGSGLLKTPVKGDAYPVLSARKTLDLMNAAPRTDHRMGIGGCASPVPQKDRLEAPCGSSASGGTAEGETLTVDKAVFGLASRTSEGRRTLVPSWLFQVRGAAGQESYTVTYPAVDPRYLASSAGASAAPSGSPEPRPSGSGTAAPVTKDVPVTAYAVRGDALTVTFEGGVCSDYQVAAREAADRVTVTVTEKRWPDRVCIAIARIYHRTVPLERPLGERKVFGADGDPVPLERPAARTTDAPHANQGQPVR